MSFRTRCQWIISTFPPLPCDSLPRDVTSRALSRRLLSFLLFSSSDSDPRNEVQSVKAVALSTAPASAGESDEDGTSKKRVRWESRSDDEEIGTVTASDDFEGTGEEVARLLIMKRCVCFYNVVLPLRVTSLVPRIDLSCD
jgi:hypothetical protein